MEKKISSELRDDYYWKLRNDYLLQYEKKDKTLNILLSDIGTFNRQVLHIWERLQKFQEKAEQSKSAVEALPNMPSPEWEKMRDQVATLLRAEFQDYVEEVIEFFTKNKCNP